MPRKLEAGGTYPYVLKSDRQLVPEPTFQIAILSGREEETVRDLSSEYSDTKDIKRRGDIVRELLGIVVRGWANMGGHAFSVEAADNLLTTREQWELINEAVIGATLTVDERKKLESPHLSATDYSADDALAASATAN